MTTQKETPTTVGFKDIVKNEFQNDEPNSSKQNAARLAQVRI